MRSWNPRSLQHVESGFDSNAEPNPRAKRVSSRVGTGTRIRAPLEHEPIPERIRLRHAEPLACLRWPFHELPPLTADRVHHVGVSVADLDAALAFWEPFLGVEARWRTVLERPYLGVHVGYPGVRIAAAFLDLPGGTVLELLDYQVEGKTALPEATANPGSTHLCLEVADARSAWERAVAAARGRSCRTAR